MVWAQLDNHVQFSVGFKHMEVTLSTYKTMAVYQNQKINNPLFPTWKYFKAYLCNHASHSYCEVTLTDLQLLWFCIRF